MNSLITNTTKNKYTHYQPINHKKRSSTICKTNESNKRSVLFDFDGVLFNHKEGLNLIADRASSFVNELVKAGPSQVKEINKRLYTGYGHTLIGLKEEYGLDIDLHTFNEYIYDPFTINSIYGMERTKEMRVKASEARLALSVAHDLGLNTYIFTNAPKLWINLGLDMLYMSHLFTNDRVISAEDYTTVKPQRQIYLDVSRKLEGHQITFVDDNLLNVSNAPSDWTTWLYNNGSTSSMSGNIHKVNNLLYMFPSYVNDYEFL